MRLYLVQHAHAVAKDVDPNRPLSDKGRADLALVMELLRPVGLRVGWIWHSSKVRAAQTAEILAEVVDSAQGPSVREGLGPNDDVEPWRGQLEAAEQDGMIVGHQPFLGKLVVCLARDGSDRWQLEWMVTPGLLSAAKSS